MSDAFENAKYYAWDDPEILEHETPEEAIEDWLEKQGSDNLEDGLEITAYDPKEIDDHELFWQAVDAMESIVESLDAKYGNPDGDPRDLISTEDQGILSGAILGVLKQLRDTGRIKVWQCEPVAHRVYTKEELLKYVEEK